MEICFVMDLYCMFVSFISSLDWNQIFENVIRNTGRIVLNQLESLLDDVNGSLRSALGNLQPFSDRTEGEATTEEEVVNSVVSFSVAIKL